MSRWLFLVFGGFLAHGLARGEAADYPRLVSFSLVDNRAFVRVKIDGRGAFAFLVDTGSSGETVNARVADALHLPGAGSGTTDGAGEKKAAYETVHLDSLSLGKMEFGAMDVPALDTAGLERAIGFTQFDGVLGTDLLRRAVVTFDFVHSRFQLNDPKTFVPDPKAVALKMDLNGDGMPIIQVTLNGLKERFQVDTGDRSSLTLFGPFWRAHRLAREMAPTVTAMTGYGIGGPIRGIVGRPPSFSVGGMEVPPPVTRLSLQKAGAFTRADYAGSIGMGVLKRFVCTFDYSHHRLYLRPAADFNYADRYDRAGLWLGLSEDNRVEVLDVTEGGPAGRAGVKSGDMVREIDGIPGNAEHLFALRELLRQPGESNATFRLKRLGDSLTCKVNLADLITPPGGELFDSSTAPAR